MNRTQTIAAVVGGTVALVGIAAISTLALLPDAFHVERSGVVAASPERVEQLVSHFPDRLAWIPWTEEDPAADYTFSGETGSTGSTMSWVGDEIGTATLTLLHVDAGREVVSELSYEAPFQMTSTDRFVLEDLGDGRTRVTWHAEGELPFGPARLFSLFADGELGPDYERGLVRLNEYVAQHRS